MAELASGAVSSLLGVIRNEAALLGGVRGDVQFIKEEMESMNSFLLYLARTVAVDGEHDEQVRTWMNQVRLLASDCNNCIDLYLYRGNPDIHLPKGGLQRYLRWTPWFLQRMVAQHRAALKLRELKDRARDVGERRLRYGVEVPAKALAAATAAAGGLPSSAAATGAEAAAAHHQDIIGDQVVAAAATTNRSGGPRGALLGLHILELEDYFKRKLAEWMEQVRQGKIAAAPGSVPLPSIALVSRGNVPGADTLEKESLDVAKTQFHHGVLVDIPAMHWWPSLRPEDILCYIWRSLEQSERQSQQQGTSQGGEQKEQHIYWRSKGKRGISYERRAVIDQIENNIRDIMKVQDKIEDINREIRQVKASQLKLELEGLKEIKNKEFESKISDKTLAVLLLLLLKSTNNTEAEAQMQTKVAAERYDKIIKITSRKLKDHMEVKEAGATEGVIRFDKPEEEYKSILREVFPSNSNSQKPQQAGLQNTGSMATDTDSTTALGEEQIKVMIQKAKQEILHEVQEKLDTLERLQEGKTDKEQATGEPGSQVQILEAVIAEESMVKIEKIQQCQDATEETTKREENQEPISETDIEEIKNKIQKIWVKIEELMKIKGIVDKIQIYLKHEKALVILKTGWHKNIFSNQLGRVASAVIVITSNDPQQAKEYCNPPCEPMEYSLVGLYQDIVLQLTRKQMTEGDHDPDSQILHSILEECKPHEFCMKIFAHALLAKPKRSNEELRKLHDSLKDVSPKSFASIAKKMLKFSYNDLQKEYKSCLLYLAIFPPGYKIKQANLIGRWIVEGLITTEDWRWSSSVYKAKICFDELIYRGLVYPADIGATGEIKSCMVGEQVHEFITKTAEKQHVVETRLSRHLARHFSISNDLRLRGSDQIEDFLKNLSESTQFYLLKVLDLEGCRCFGLKNKRYLKDICRKIKLLKYLSLRRTDVVQLPDEINNLHELEVLDIRQTSLHMSSTRKIRLLKLKRLLVGHIDPDTSSDTKTGTRVYSFPNSTYIPEKVEKMENMEVLSNVKPQTTQDLKDIEALWQLRKLGVVIEDKETHLMTLLEVISNLNKCIRSLSITFLPNTRREGIPSCGWLLQATDAGLKRTYKLDDLPKVVLESLSIRGTYHQYQKESLLTSLLPSENSQLTKITLSNTKLSQHDLGVLSEQRMLSCVKLRYIEYIENNKLTFKMGEFKKLKYFLIEGSKMTEIIFEDGATGELEKMVLPLTDGLNLSGLDKLLRLEELELNDNNNKSNNSTTSNSNDINSNGNEINRKSITTATIATATATVATVPTIAADAPNTNSTNATNATVPVAAATNATMVAANDSTNITTTTTATTTTTGIDTTTVTNASQVTGATTATNSTSPNRAPTDINIIKNDMLRSLFDSAKRITKVTLRGTMLKQDGLQILAKKPSIRCLVLLDKSYDESQLTFDKEDFPNLNLLIVECTNITKINFTDGSCPRLQKFIWTFNNMSVVGIGNLPRLKEAEFHGVFVHDEVKEEITRHKNKPYFTHYKPEKENHQLENMVQQSHGTKYSCFQRDKGFRQKRN